MSYETNPAKRVELLDYEKERLNVYHIEEMEDVFADRVGKPSHRIFETKGGRRALEGLRTIERDYNKSWTRCVRERWADILDKEMIFYRGNVISAEETFRRSDELARAMANAGIEKGDEIACCMSNVPEVLYLMNAASSLGAKLNFFGGHYDPEFVAIILSECSPKLFIATDDEFAKIRDIVKGQHFDHKVLVSLADSLPEHPETCEGYEPSLAADYQFENLAAKFVAEDPNLTTFADFVESGKSFTGEIIDDNGLDTEFLVTYTSGSTKIGFPKREIHRNRSLITVGVFHDPELCGNPAIHGLRGMAYIHTDTDTDPITMISDSMFQLWSVSFEPLYDRKTFLDRLVMNKPNFVLATTSFCVEAARQYLFEGRYAGRTLDSLLVLMAVGEACLPGEEKVINTFLRKARAGRGVNLAGPIHFPFVTVGVGGGDTEHGGVYYSLWRRMNEVLNKPKLHGKPYGLA
ncbi:MAG: acyl--CoA ligase, partial [Clostridia bacterium]|nr:acyl--CoA ligase [Clostridia bacterium]